MFEHQLRVRMRNTDATGYLFFSDQFTLAVEAFEEFLLSVEIGQIETPIVHAEADYKKPVKLADLLKIQLGIKHLGNTSFTMLYLLRNHANEEVGRVEIVHVYIDPITRKSTSLPLKLRFFLEQHLWHKEYLNAVLKEE